MSFEEYSVSTGEPAAIQPKIWNGELMAYQRTLLNKLYKLKNPKDIQKTIVEIIKTTYHVQNEMRKAGFYKEEFDQMSDFLNHLELLSTSEETEEVTDEFGKIHLHTLNTKRSLVKSIPAVRAAIQGQ